MYERYRHSIRDSNMSANDDPFGQKDNADEPMYEPEDNFIYFDIVEGNSEMSVEDIMERIETMDTSGVRQEYSRLMKISEMNEDITQDLAERLKRQDRFAEAEMSTFDVVQDDNDIWTKKLAAVTKRYKNYRDEAERIKCEHISYERESEMLEERTETMTRDVRKIVEDLEELEHRREILKELALEEFDTVNCEAKDQVKENDQNYELLDSLRKELNILKIKELEKKECSSSNEKTLDAENSDVSVYKSVSNTFIDNKVIDVEGLNQSGLQVGNLTVVSRQRHENNECKENISGGKQNNADQGRPNSVCQTRILKRDLDTFEQSMSKALADVNKDKHDKFLSVRPFQTSRGDQTIDLRHNQHNTEYIIIGSVCVKALECVNSKRRPVESLSARKTQSYEPICNKTRMKQVNRQKQADNEGKITLNKSFKERNVSIKVSSNARVNIKTETATLNVIAKTRQGREVTVQKRNHVQQKLGEDLTVLAKTCRKENKRALSHSSKVESIHSKPIPAKVSVIENKHEKDEFFKKSTIMTDNALDITQRPFTPALISVESQKTTKTPLPPIAAKHVKKGTRKRCKIGSVSVEDALPSITPITVGDDHAVICVVPVSSPRPVYAKQTGGKFDTRTPPKTTKPRVKLSTSDKTAAINGSKGSNTTMKLVGNGKLLNRR